jgi:hypothetical protein
MTTRIKIKKGAGTPSGLTFGELAYDVTNKRLFIGITSGNALLTNTDGGVASFNGITGAVSGVTVGGTNVFTALNSFTAGISASKITTDYLVVAAGSTFGAAVDHVFGLSNRGLKINAGKGNSEILTYGNDDLSVSAMGGNLNLNLFGGIVTVGDDGNNDGTQITVADTGGQIITYTAANGHVFNGVGSFGGMLTTTGGISVPGEAYFSNITGIQLTARAPLRFYDTDSSNYVAFRAGLTVGSNITWTLPTADGSSNQVLTTDGSSTLSWSTPSGVTVGGTNVFTALNTFNVGISAAGATFSGAISTPSTAIQSRVPAGTGVTPTVQIICPSSAQTLLNQTATQPVFSTPQDTITLQASTTYMFEGLYLLSTGTTSHSTAMSFVLTTATMTNCTWVTHVSPNTALNNTAAGIATAIFNAVAGGTLNSANTNQYLIIRFQGMMRVNAGGTLVPNIAFSSAPGGTNTTMIGSYLKFYPIGSNTVDFVGSAIG